MGLEEVVTPVEGEASVAGASSARTIVVRYHLRGGQPL